MDFYYQGNIYNSGTLAYWFQEEKKVEDQWVYTVNNDHWDLEQNYWLICPVGTKG